MDAIKKYLIRNFEQVFVLLLLIVTAFINYAVPYKLAFLHFYFIPILLAGYYLDYRKAVLGAFFCILIVVIYTYLSPEIFIMDTSIFTLSIHLFLWGSFLILTGATIGMIQKRLREEISAKTNLSHELTESKNVLDTVTQELRSHSEHLEEKISERTESLEKSKRAMEDIKEKVEDALYATMDPSVVKMIIEKRLRTEKRTLSVVFADLKSFTEYSEERGPETVVTQLNSFFGEMEDVLFRYRGHIDKYMGDCIMAEFGAPTDYERHSLMAVLAALKMQERSVEKRFPWKMRVGIATGEAIIGLIGQKRQSYTALGDVVNLANRIQGLCMPGGVTIDEATYEDVKIHFETKRKTMHSFSKAPDPVLEKEINECAVRLDKNPDDMDSMKRMGFLLMKAEDPLHAYDYLKKVMSLDPNDDKVKLAFADCSIKSDEMYAITIRGKKVRMHLYDVVGVKDPLLDRVKIPQDLYDRYLVDIEKIFPYPEDIVWPVECIDGSIGHSKVAGFLCYALADHLHLPDQDKLDLLMAGYFHDLGKTIVPHHLLNRTGAISSKESEEVAKHSRESVRVLKTMGYENERLFDIISYHHENFRGGGYPDGLSGEKIPVGSRMLAIADSYDALTSWRPYRNRWDCEAAIDEMQRNAAHGKFDSSLLESFVAMIRR